MLTRLRVSGFKNLVDVDVRFGAFTCIAGANGVGKSNLFDAIRFLSFLADKPIIEAALSVRNEEGRSADVRNLFHRIGDAHDASMRFEVEMIIPREGIDDFGQKARASTTFLRYSLTLAFRADPSNAAAGGLEIVSEELAHIKKGSVRDNLLFPHDPKTWRPSAIAGKRFAPYFISTGGEGEQRVIKLHQDGGSSGRPVPRVAERLPRTVLSAVNAVESPTALLARREMQSWRLLQLEPSALREPDEVTAPSSLRANGAHLPATLFRLARTLENNESRGAVCARVANRLSELISDVRRVEIDHDSKRELLTLQVVDANNTRHAARSLSDGTLRFLALSVLEIDPEAQGLLCLEEPENGIHPDRIPAMLRLLQDIAVDVHIAIDEENPLRQVIINTHSPAVVQEVPEDSLLLAELRELVENGRRIKTMRFSALSNTWQTTGPSNGQVGRIMSKGKLIQYLNPASLNSARPGSDSGRERRRVIDRDDSQMLLATLYPDTE